MVRVKRKIVKKPGENEEPKLKKTKYDQIIHHDENCLLERTNPVINYFELLPNEIIIKILNYTNFVTWETCKGLNKQFYHILNHQNPFLPNIFWYVVFITHTEHRNGFEEHILLSQSSTNILNCLNGIATSFVEDCIEELGDTSYCARTIEATFHLIDLTDLKKRIKGELELVKQGMGGESELSPAELNKKSVFAEISFFTSKKIEEFVELIQNDLSEEEAEDEGQEQEGLDYYDALKKKLSKNCQSLQTKCSKILDATHALHKKSQVKDHLISVVNSLRIYFEKAKPTNQEIIYLLRFEKIDCRLFQPKPLLAIGNDGLRHCLIRNLDLDASTSLRDIARMNDSELIQFTENQVERKSILLYLKNAPEEKIATRESVSQYGP